METPIGEALKTLNKKKQEKKTIRVCDNCGSPLIWTFAFDYKERYCLNCGLGGGMLGTGTDMPVTRELIFQEKLVNAIWKVIYGKKGLVPISAGRTNCVKCLVGGRHYNHLSKAEKEWDKIARLYLEKIKGFINPLEN